MAANGLRQTVDGLQMHLMAEVPNNAMEIDGLADLFDGIAIGSRDLTQVILGIDAGAAFVSAADFDPCNPGVLRCIQMLIEGAERHDCPISICGPPPSERPEMAEFAVRHGTDCLSLRPDSVVETTRNVRQLEQDLRSGDTAVLPGSRKASSSARRFSLGSMKMKSSCEKVDAGLMTWRHSVQLRQKALILPKLHRRLPR
ncbi:MAG: hypothetical protein OSB69_12475 [Alphaproteobacteria bacterium]|nr:hypothetical protein [Alphaproteobacteria bacterium]